MKRENWVWMPHPGHLIVGQDCRFHLSTYVGRFLVSTVGEYLPDSGTREILAKSRGIVLEGIGDYRRADYMKKIGYETIGYERLYETMVFKAIKHKGNCCDWRQESGSELDFEGYNESKEATKGHMKMCLKWSKKNGM